jgi:hypothetical protein
MEIPSALARVLAASISLSLAPAQAQSTCTNGKIAIIRTSEVTGSLDTFKKAIADQTAWYKSHGLTNDVISYGQAFELDQASRTVKPVPGKYVTFHFNAGNDTSSLKDAAWDAFVAEFAASSKIVSTSFVCVAD